MRYSLTIAALLLAFCSRASAQGSPYDLFGFGIPIFTSDSHLQGMSGAGVSLTDPRIVASMNPASWNWLTRARLESDLSLTLTQSSQPSLSNSQATNVHFGGFAFGTPILDSGRLGLGIGFQPLTDASAENSISDSSQSATYRSFGGVSQAYLGLGGSLVHNTLALGGRVDVLFGNVVHQSQVTFTDPSIAGGIFERDYALSGVRGTFGMILSTDSIFHSSNGINIGVTYSTPTSLSTASRTVITPVTSVLDTTLEIGGVGRFPGSLQLGVSAHFAERYRIAFEMDQQDFSTAYLYSTTAISGDPSLGASKRYAVGIERQPVMADEFGDYGFWQKLGLRAGASYYQLPLVVSGAGNVNELAFSVGLGIPITFESLLDIAFIGGQRTPVNLGTSPKDLFFELSVTLSLSERWFIPTRAEE